MTDFIDLHLHSTYSNLDGFGSPEQIVQKAKEIGRNSIALTDHGSISGLVKLKKACKENEVKAIYGCEFYMVESLEKMRETKLRTKNHITVLASNEKGYQNLLQLSSLSYQKGFYYRPTIDKELLFEKEDGLIVLSGCWSGALQNLLKEGKQYEAECLAKEFQQVFGDRYYLETQHFPLFEETIDAFQNVSNKLGIPMVLTCDPHYLTADEAPIQEILHAIRDRREFDKEQIIYGAYQWPAEDLLDAVKKLFPSVRWEELFENVCAVGDRCNVEMPFGAAPVFPVENKKVEDLFFKKCKEGIKYRNLENAGDVYRERFKKEYNLIIEKGFVDYFMIVADIVNWAKGQGILVGPARGSSAGSLICYLMGITEINPIDYDLVFERFIDESRFDLPDIDIDFDGERRDEVKQYMANKYGNNSVCSLATFASFKGKNSLDEIGKVFAIPKSNIETIKKYLIERSKGDDGVNSTIEDTFKTTPEAKEIFDRYNNLKYASMLEGQLRHMSKHAAGVIVGNKPLDEIIGLYERDNQILGSIEMEDAVDLGLLKIDILGIKELTILKSICDLIGWSIDDLYKIPLDDEKTFDGFRKIDVSGIFQFSGDATKSVLRQMPYLDFEQLIACVTLSKPGPAYGGGTTNYLSYANGNTSKAAFDWHPKLKDITKNTYYQIIYQEQVLRVVREIGNLSWPDANKVRAAMAKSKGEQEFDTYWTLFLKGAKENGLNEKQAKEVWASIKTMGRYAFNKSHSVSYATLAFWSMYMKQNYPLEFYVSRLSKETDKDKIQRLLMEIDRRGIPIYPPVLGKSIENWKIEGKGLRSGLTEVDGIGEKVAERLVSDNYLTREDFKTKKNRGVTKRTLKNLEDSNAFDVGMEDFFDVGQYDILSKISPNRESLEDIRDGDEEYEIEVAGLFKSMKYKDIHEVGKAKGYSTATVKSPEISKYALLSLEDESDRCLVNINRFLFDRIGKEVWEAYDKENFVIIKGKKVSGWRIVRCKEMKIYTKEGKRIA